MALASTGGNAVQLNSRQRFNASKLLCTVDLATVDSRASLSLATWSCRKPDFIPSSTSVRGKSTHGQSRGCLTLRPRTWPAGATPDESTECIRCRRIAYIGIARMPPVYYVTASDVVGSKYAQVTEWTGDNPLRTAAAGILTKILFADPFALFTMANNNKPRRRQRELGG